MLIHRHTLFGFSRSYLLFLPFWLEYEVHVAPVVTVLFQESFSEGNKPRRTSHSYFVDAQMIKQNIVNSS